MENSMIKKKKKNPTKQCDLIFPGGMKAIFVVLDWPIACVFHLV